jgi:putative ABC transport system permease protein
MFPTNADIWRPMANLPPVVRQSRAERRLAVFARLADGRTREHARVEMASLGTGWAREQAATNRDVQMAVVPINEQLNPSVAQRAWMAFITAGVLVLLVACANVANLLLMRAATRGREMAIRTAIGASRSRVVRQLLVESATLSVLAATFGVVVAWAGLRMLAAIVPPETLPYWMAFTMDGSVLAVVIGVCVLSVFLCGLPSALHVSKVDLRDTLTDSGTTGARPTRRWIAALLAAEFAITLVLVTVAVTGVRNGVESRRAEFQIDRDSLLTMSVALGLDLYPTSEKRVAFFEQLDQAVGSSVGPMAYASVLPYGGGQQQPLTLVGRSIGDQPPTVSVIWASERYFDVLRIPIVGGRAFSPLDGRPGSEAAIVNERFVQMFLSGQEPIGARIHVGMAETPWLQIVGVATTVRQQVFGPQPDPVVFLPFRTSPLPVTAVVLRAAGDPVEPIATLRREAARLDPNLPLYRVMTFERAVQNAFWNIRLSDTIIRSIAAVTLLLALIGLYAVIGHTVERWTKELALRIALGAGGRQIVWLVIRRVLMQLSIGLALGLVATLAFDRLFSDPATRSASSVQMMDVTALVAIVMSIAVVAVIACLVPIRRAARVDPLVALRSE